MDRMGIIIYYVASDGETWAKFVGTKLHSAPYAIDVKFVEFTASTVLPQNSNKLCIFFITPDLLDITDLNCLGTFTLESSMGVLTGVNFNDLELVAKRKHCRNVLDWFFYEMVEHDLETSVRELMLSIIGAYEGDLDLAHNVLSPVSPRASPDYSDDYDRLPPPKQVNSVQDIFVKGDKVFVVLERRAEGHLTLSAADTEIQPDPYLTVYTFTCTATQNTNFTVTLNGVSLKDNSIKSSEINNNPSISHSHVSQVTSPVSTVTHVTPKQTVSISTQTDGPPIPSPRQSLILKTKTPSSTEESVEPELTLRNNDKTEARPRHTGASKLEQIRILLEDETDPEQILCRCLGIENDIKLLDDKMKSMVEYTENFKHMSFPVHRESQHVADNEKSKWPSLLHFGARYNLLSFCDVLLSSPLMYDECLRSNKDGHRPHEIARQHGHTELAILLEHFSSFVKADKDSRYDSGISGFSGYTPRLSTITLMEDPRSELAPPKPHVSTAKSPGYIRMSSEPIRLDDYDTESVPPTVTLKSHLKKQKPYPLKLSVKEEVDSSQEEEEEYCEVSELDKSTEVNTRNPSTKPSTPRSQPIPITPPFKDILDLSLAPSYQDTERRDSNYSNQSSTENRFSERSNSISSYSNQSSTLDRFSERSNSISSAGSRSTIGSHDLPEGGKDLRRKNLVSFFGSDSPPISGSPTDHSKKKSSIFSNLLSRTKKGRSQSEPTIISMTGHEEGGNTLEKKKEVVYRRNIEVSPRSQASSGTSSSYSTTSSQMSVEEEAPMRTKKKSKKKFLKFLDKTKKRQSVRIKHVHQDKNLTAPKLPSRIKCDEEF